METVGLLYLVAVNIGPVFAATVGEIVSPGAFIPANLGLKTMNVGIVNSDLGGFPAANRDNSSILVAGNLCQNSAIVRQEIRAGLNMNGGVTMGRLREARVSSQLFGNRENKVSCGIVRAVVLQRIKTGLNTGPLIVISIGFMAPKWPLVQHPNDRALPASSGR